MLADTTKALEAMGVVELNPPGEDFCEAIRLVSQFFKGDPVKTTLWFLTPNPMFGYIRPTVIAQVRGERFLLDWIKAQLAENPPDEAP